MGVICLYFFIPGAYKVECTVNSIGKFIEILFSHSDKRQNVLFCINHISRTIYAGFRFKAFRLLLLSGQYPL